MALETNEIAQALGQLLLERLDLGKRLDEAEKKLKFYEQAGKNEKRAEPSPPLKTIKDN